MSAEPPGICPLCESRTGAVGDPCPSEVCGRKGYRFIPVGWYESAKAYATRKQKALDPLLGRCIDRYLLAGKLGEGGMGAVYLALQRPLNREVALKVISGLDLTQSTVARFEREARAIALLEHANIRKLHDYGIGELEFRVPYMALEYVRHGRTLRDALGEIRQSNAGQIPGTVVLTIFRQVLNALAAAHAKGIIHRDMKPDNVMIAPEHGNLYMVKILDFGLAKAISDVSGFDGDVSRTGHVLGTPHYMAPEQVPRRGRPEADGRADLYAVAVMLYEVVTGARPYDGESALEVMARKVDPEYDPMDLPAARTLTRQMRAFLAKGLATEPADRYPDADAMLEVFEKTLSERATSVIGLTWSPSAHPSDERPATPPSPALSSQKSPGSPSVEPVLAPTARLEGDDERKDRGTGVSGPSTIDRRPGRIVVVRKWLWALAALAVLAGVLAFRAITPRLGPPTPPGPLPAVAPVSAPVTDAPDGTKVPTPDAVAVVTPDLPAAPDSVVTSDTVETATAADVPAPVAPETTAALVVKGAEEKLGGSGGKGSSGGKGASKSGTMRGGTSDGKTKGGAGGYEDIMDRMEGKYRMDGK